MEIILREITYYKIVILTMAILIIIFVLDLNRRVQLHIERAISTSNPNKVASSEIKQAMQKMGPNYIYRLLPDGTLQVDKGDGKWLKLKYERGKDGKED